ncbi:MAG: diaminopimelate epimerase [Lachnospiraceae bacterium]
MKTIVMKKYHGLGNDYLVLDPNKNDIHLQERNIQKLCQRNFGVGADGILYGPINQDGQIEVLIFNPDGSEAERSGNGVRIFAKYLLDEGYIKDKKFKLKTKAGLVEIEFLDMIGSQMRVNMGRPDFMSSAIPMAGAEHEIINEPMTFHDSLYNTTCLSVGNPNCVIMTEKVSPKEVVELGPFVENAPVFPNRMNLQICRVDNKNELTIEIYERGAGYTLASGTGACAAAAAAYKLGLVESRVTVHMPGGDLVIEIEEDGTIYMTGSVTIVGEFRLAENFFA